MIDPIIRFEEKIREQLHFIKNSASAFDDGIFSEAIRIAIALRIIFHDTRNSTSLLTHLGIKDQIHILSTALPYDESILAFSSTLHCLTIKITNPGRIVEPVYEPVLNEGKSERFLKVTDYLNENIYFIDNTYISRKDLILWIADQDGGAHVDSTDRFSPTFKRILTHGIFKYDVTDADPPNYIVGVEWNAIGEPSTSENIFPILGAHLADIRQMGYEILNTPDLKKYV